MCVYEDVYLYACVCVSWGSWFMDRRDSNSRVECFVERYFHHPTKNKVKLVSVLTQENYQTFPDKHNYKMSRLLQGPGNRKIIFLLWEVRQLFHRSQRRIRLFDLHFSHKPLTKTELVAISARTSHPRRNQPPHGQLGKDHTGKTLERWRTEVEQL